MSWFNLAGTVVFGGLRVCDNSLDFDITSNAFGYFNTFPDSTCILQPSEVFSSYQCWTNTTTPATFQAGCPDQPLYDLDFKFEQALNGLSTNFSLNASWGCENFYMERNATGYTIVLTDNTSASGCSGSVTVSSTSSSASPSISTTASLPTSTLTSTALSTSPSTSQSSSTSTSPTTTLTSTVLTTTTYTITSCPAAVTNCHPGSVTTEVITTQPGISTHNPSSSSTTVTSIASEMSNNPSESPPITSSFPSSSPSSISLVPPSLGATTATSTTTPAVFVGAGTRVRGPSSSMLFSVLFLILCTIISPTLCLFDSAAAEAVSPKQAPAPRNIPTRVVHKRIPIDNFADIAAFGPPLAAVLETNLPIPPGDPNPLTSYIANVNNNVCQAGRNNAATYGASWTTMTGKHLLGQMLADCVTLFDQVSLDTYIFATTQSPSPESEEGVVFFKFVGALYCNRLIVTLVKDPANLDMICRL